MRESEYVDLRRVGPEITGRFFKGQPDTSQPLFAPVEVVSRGRGAWLPNAGSDSVGSLVVRGFAVRRLSMLGRTGAWLFGPGDVIPVDDPSALFPWLSTTDWVVLSELGLARLHLSTVPSAERPRLAAAVAGSIAPSSAQAAAAHAIQQIRGVEARILSFLWYVAERWGYRGVSAETYLPVALPRQILGALVSVGRQTTSTALGRLQELGFLELGRSQWRLNGSPTDVEELLSYPGALSATTFRSSSVPAMVAALSSSPLL